MERNRALMTWLEPLDPARLKAVLPLNFYLCKLISIHLFVLLSQFE